MLGSDQSNKSDEQRSVNGHCRSNGRAKLLVNVYFSNVLGLKFIMSVSRNLCNLRAPTAHPYIEHIVQHGPD